MSKTRTIPDVVMDILNDYPLVNGGRKPLLDYIDEIMKDYQNLESEYQKLVEWQENINKDIREMKIVIRNLKKDKN